ncbi:hypothetical protein OS493_008504 [Desmophyllum pertusum]|uniref:Uncharacterized protein n=1 Tax=Desmophyllum pertusum TaxID=174260 RepID=A0A9X0D4N5_9CNID|nr:hypothetical protein OS493_008504 [Desmophyllum pertusum]
MKTTMIFLGLLVTVALFSQTECFTAGIGNVGKRQVNKLYASLDRVCRETQAICLEAANTRRSKTVKQQSQEVDN